MAKANKSKSMVEYEKQVRHMHKRLHDIEKKFGESIKLSFKYELPAHAKNAKEAREGLKFIEQHRHITKFLELTEATRKGSGGKVEHFNPQELYRAYFIQYLIRSGDKAEYEATKKVARKMASENKKPGTFDKDEYTKYVDAPIKPSLYPADAKGLRTLLDKSRKTLARKNRRKDKQVSVVKNFKKTIESYPEPVRELALKLIDGMSTAEAARRIDIMYKKNFKNEPNGSALWYQFWDSDGTGIVGRDEFAQILLEGLGASLLEQTDAIIAAYQEEF